MNTSPKLSNSQLQHLNHVSTGPMGYGSGACAQTRTVKSLERKGYVFTSKKGFRDVYAITEAGTQALRGAK